MSISTLVKLVNKDLLVLQEMEYNGMKYNLELSKQLGDEILERIKEIKNQLLLLFPDIPINWSSPDHVSATLYGGVVKVREREAFEFRYKDGRTKIKEKWVVNEYNMPRLVEPVKGSQLAKEGFWSTAEDILKQLHASKKAKEIIKLITELSLLETKVSRYYHGIPEKYIEKGWQGGIIHGQLNQCVARTGRLSSSDPNMQNMDGVAKQCFVSRFPE